MTILSSANRIPVSHCDAVISQYDTFLDNIPTVGSEEFRCYDKKNTRIDEFLMTRMEGENYHKLRNVLRMVLVLSHGQASVERGFSVNKKVETENLSQKSMVSQRLICEYVNECGGIAQVPISKELLRSASAARQRYRVFLDEQRAARKTVEESRKRKAALDDLELQKQKRQCLEEDIASLNASAEKLSEKAELPTNSLKEIRRLITQANSFRRTAKEKSVELETVKDSIKDAQNAIKNIWPLFIICFATAELTKC